MHFNKIKVVHVVLQTALKLNTLFGNWIGKSIIDIKNNKEKQKTTTTYVQYHKFLNQQNSFQDFKIVFVNLSRSIIRLADILSWGSTSVLPF